MSASLAVGLTSNPSEAKDHPTNLRDLCWYARMISRPPCLRIFAAFVNDLENYILGFRGRGPPFSFGKTLSLFDSINLFVSYTSLFQVMAVIKNNNAGESQNDAQSEVADLPAYTAEENPFGSTFPTSEEEKAHLKALYGESPAPEVPIQPTATTLGHASTSTLSRGLQVVSLGSRASSGFAYPSVLAEHGVSAADWEQFTSLITKAASMKPDDWILAVGGGVGTLFVAGIFIGWLAFIPAVIVGRSIHKRAELRNLEKARGVGDLEHIILSWNETFFAPRGLLIRLDLPGELPEDIQKMDVAGPAAYHHCMMKRAQRLSCKWDDKKQAKFANKMSKVEAKMAKMEAKMAKKEFKMAYKRGRIVILPISKAGQSVGPDLYASPSNGGSQLDEKELL